MQKQPENSPVGCLNAKSDDSEKNQHIVPSLASTAAAKKPENQEQEAKKWQLEHEHKKC